MRRGLVWVVALLTFVPAAPGASPQVSAQVSAAVGEAPLHVTLTTGGDAASYQWDFGDSTFGEGRTVEHTYSAGRWTAVVTARSAAGETATAQVVVTAYGLTLAGPVLPRFGRRTTYRGKLVPAVKGDAVVLVAPRGQIASARTRADGSYVLRAAIRTPGDYFATSEKATSPILPLRLVPRLRTALVGGGARGSRYFLNASVRPVGAGTLAVKIDRGGSTLVDRTFAGRVRLKLDTRRLTAYRIRVEVVPSEGYAGIARRLLARVMQPRLAYGSRSAVVAQLSAQLRALHYAAPAAAAFDGRMLDAVYAFQKVQGLARTGVVDAPFWRRLASPRAPIPRYAGPAAHLEVDKARQVLYVVRNSRVSLIVPVSTAGLPGKYTPVGRFAIYRKVGGFDPSPLGTLYDPMYFTGGYAIHGNPSVPPYPASHGCIRVPMWIAGLLYATNPYGETVYVY